MKPFYLIFIILFLCSSSEVYAQRSNGLTVEGTVSVEQGSVQGAVIEMYRNGQRLDNYGIGGNGRYRVELNYNYEFTLVFSLKDNFSQKVVVDTRVPKEVVQSDPLFPPFPVNIKLFTEIEGIDKTFSENPVMKIYYSEKIDNFISDLFYNDAQIKHIIDQAILQSQKIGKEADLLAGVTRTELAELRKEYDKLVKQAENEYNREEFLTALDGYKAANKIFPKEQYPKDRIDEINDLLGLQMVAEEMKQALTARLNALIAQGDKQFDQKKYDDARTTYQRSLSIDAENTHAQARIKEITNIVETTRLNREYDAFIVAADNAFDELLFVEAKNLYARALELKGSEKYPQQKITAIDEILKQQALNAEKLEGYKASIFQAELNFEKQFYDKAITFYENALVHKPGDEVATRKIDEIKMLMTQLANKTLYDKRIKTADKSFKKNLYEEALLEYKEAAKLMPTESYPLSQIEQINAIFAEQERLAAEAEAEKARLAAEARAAEQARLAALEAEKEKQYNRALFKGDSLFQLKKYEDSRTAYQSALQVKPGEALPGQRINAIDELIGQLAAAQLQYDEAVSRGNDAFKQNSFDGAKAAYLEAQKAKPEEMYPRQMITQIDSVLQAQAQLAAEAEAEKARLAAEAEAAEQARLAALEAEKEKEYDRRITRADSLFLLEKYENSLSEYQLALKLRSEENYPEQRIREVNKILNELELAQKEREKLEQNYQNAIHIANQQFISKDFLQAKANYEVASKIKPDESYPKQRIAEANQLLLQLELDEKYSSVILAADGFFQDEAWTEARTEYQNALAIKPNENYPTSQIAKINTILKQHEERILAEQKAAAEMERRRMEIEQQQKVIKERQEINESGLNQMYNEYISLADRFFDNKNYNVSRAWYYKARDIKLDEKYPQQRINEINRLVSSMQLSQRDRDYQNYINLADSTFRENQLAVSRGWYNRALSVKTDEAYPKEQLQAIADLISERMASRSGEEYDDHIKKGTEAFESGNYNVARYWYKKALDLRPDDNSTKEKLLEIQMK